jgi:phospho-N-acetylmuramoyl-pentapeptide-transferase
MGGVLIWVSVFLTALILLSLGNMFDGLYGSLNFISRSQTWLPLMALLVGALVGGADDILEITRSSGGLRLRYRLGLVALLGIFSGWWFFVKLGVSSVGVPFAGPVELGVWFIPFFMVVMLAVYASGIIDGIDGLAGGVFTTIFMTYAGIAFVQNQVSLAALAATIAGAILAFLWFNIPPARFYMSETGTMALTCTLAIMAFSADVLGDGVGVSMLPLIAFPLTVTVVTSLLQVFWKKVFKRKLFLIAPIHHHFEALGWPAAKVTMRYWVITIIAGVLGLALALVG